MKGKTDRKKAGIKEGRGRRDVYEKRERKGCKQAKERKE